MWDLTVSVPDHCLSFYFDDFWILFKIALWTSAGKKLVMFYCMPSLFFCVPFPYEPCLEKTCLRGLRPGKTQTGLLSFRSY